MRRFGNQYYKDRNIQQIGGDIANIMVGSASQDAAIELAQKRAAEARLATKKGDWWSGKVNAAQNLGGDDAYGIRIGEAFGYKNPVNAQPLARHLAYTDKPKQWLEAGEIMRGSNARTMAENMMLAPETAEGEQPKGNLLGAYALATGNEPTKNTVLSSSLQRNMLDSDDKFRRDELALKTSTEINKDLLNFKRLTGKDLLEDKRERDFNEVKEARLSLDQALNAQIELAKNAGEQSVALKLGTLKEENLLKLGQMDLSIQAADNLLKDNTNQIKNEMENSRLTHEINLDAANEGAQNLFEHNIKTKEADQKHERALQLQRSKEARLQIKDSVDQAIQMAKNAGDLALTEKLELKKIENEKEIAVLNSQIEQNNNEMNMLVKILKLNNEKQLTADNNAQNSKDFRYQIDEKTGLEKWLHNNRQIEITPIPGQKVRLDQATGKKLNIQPNENGEYILDGGPAPTKEVFIKVGKEDIYLTKDQASVMGITKNDQGQYVIPGKPILGLNQTMFGTGEGGEQEIIASTVEAKEPEIIKQKANEKILTPDPNDPTKTITIADAFTESEPQKLTKKKPDEEIWAPNPDPDNQTMIKVADATPELDEQGNKKAKNEKRVIYGKTQIRTVKDLYDADLGRHEDFAKLPKTVQIELKDSISEEVGKGYSSSKSKTYKNLETSYNAIAKEVFDKGVVKVGSAMDDDDIYFSSDLYVPVVILQGADSLSDEEARIRFDEAGYNEAEVNAIMEYMGKTDVWDL